MDIAFPVLAAIAAWWLSTIVLIYRAGLPAPSFRWTFAGTSVAMLVGVWAVLASRHDPSTAGAYVAFLGALAIWAWHEVSYLFGFVSGPRPAPCPRECSGWERFRYGIKACLYHELAVVVTAGLIWAATWQAENRVALGTFLILWLMRWSVKLNIFLGVRNFHAEFWPDHLRYLESFVRERPINALFPFSMLAAGTGLLLLGASAADAAAFSPRRTGALLLATLLALATIEHLLLVLKIPDERLWSLGLKSRRGRAAPTLGPKIEHRL